MKNNSPFVFPVLLVLITVFGVETGTAQFNIKIPKIPKVEKPKLDQPKPDQSKPDVSRSDDAPATSPQSSESSRYSAAVRKSQYGYVRPDARPLLVKDSIYIQADTRDEYWKMPGQKYSSWLPTIRFGIFYDWEVTLPHLVEYFNPDGSLWFSEMIEGERPGPDRVVPFKTPRAHVDKMWESKSTAATGLYGVKITNKTNGEVIFQGKFKVGKFPRDYKGKNSPEFYVDHDWIMPIGTVSFHHSSFSGQDVGSNFPVQVGMWFKKAIGSTDHGFEAKLFYKDQQIATTKGLQANETRASESANLSGELHHWARWDFQWTFDGNVGNVTVDNGGSYHRDNTPKSYFVDRNPGEYTVKVFHKGVQVREARFTMGTDGRIVDGGYYKPGYLTYYKVMIPVKVMPGAEKYNPAAWKTEAFYGNPLTGFVVP